MVGTAIFANTPPNASHTDLVDIALRAAASLFDADDCWLQTAGAWADAALDRARRSGGSWIDVVPGGDTAAARSWAVADVPAYDGPHALVVWHARPRVWERSEILELRSLAEVLGRELDRTRAGQRSEGQRVRAELDDERRRLVTRLRHELRTPLAVVVGSVDVLRLTCDDPVVTARLDAIERATDRLTRLADNLDRIDPDFGSDSTGPCDVAEVAEACAVTARRRRTDVTVHLQVAPAVAAASRWQIQSMLEPVLDNAVVVSPAGGHVVVHVVRQDQWVLVTVTDQGPGISADQLHRIGEDFFRTDHAQVTERQGAGLGLAAAMAQASATGARLALEAGVDGGTRAVLWVPVACGH